MPTGLYGHSEKSAYLAAIVFYAFSKPSLIGYRYLSQKLFRDRLIWVVEVKLSARPGKLHPSFHHIVVKFIVGQVERIIASFVHNGQDPDRWKTFDLHSNIHFYPSGYRYGHLDINIPLLVLLIVVDRHARSAHLHETSLVILTENRTTKHSDQATDGLDIASLLLFAYYPAGRTRL
jgi:hypothetical protein